MDNADIATNHQNILNNAALAKLRRQSEKLFSGKIPKCCECIDCGEPIPQKRLECVPGAVRCIECQRLYESSSY